MITMCLLAASMAAEPVPAPLTTTLPVALRQDTPAPTEAPAGLETPGAPAVEQTRPYLMEVNVRGRYLAVPDSVLDIWYYNGDDDGGQHPERPKARAYSVGMEYAIRNDTQSGIFYFDYIGNLMDEGYWDDVEDDANYLDGDYIKPEGLSILALGANYYYTLNATPWLGFMFGAGLGVAVVRGELLTWDGEDGEPSYVVYERGEAPNADPVRIPKVLPMVDINTAIKFNINNRASIRIEGGFHDLLYVGGAMGVTF